MINLADLFTITITLFAVIDILGNIPLIINIRQKTGKINAFKVTWVSALIMLTFLFIGEESGLIVFAVGIVITMFMVGLATRSFGGITGDVLGATNEITRLASLLIFVSL